ACDRPHGPGPIRGLTSSGHVARLGAEREWLATAEHLVNADLPLSAQRHLRKNLGEAAPGYFERLIAALGAHQIEVDRVGFNVAQFWSQMRDSHGSMLSQQTPAAAFEGELLRGLLFGFARPLMARDGGGQL